MKNYSVDIVKNYGSLSLAFAGDAVQSLYVKTRLVEEGFVKPNHLQIETANRIKANAQSLVLDFIFDELTEDEKNIVMRARNSKTNNTPKNSNLVEYKKSTSFEALLGFLYFTGQKDRLDKFLKISFEGVKK